MQKQIDKIIENGIKTVIIFDACRYDYLYDIASPEYEVLKVDSNAYITKQYYRQNWANIEHKKWRLITAQIQALKAARRRNTFAKHYYIGKHSPAERTGWLEPSATFDKAVSLADKGIEYLIIHLIPPHLPYVTKEGIYFQSEVAKLPYSASYDNIAKWAGDDNDKWDEIRRQYKIQVEYVFSETLKYIDRLQKPLVITADHGELLGEIPDSSLKDTNIEWPVYGHKYKSEILKMVPWIEFS